MRVGYGVRDVAVGNVLSLYVSEGDRGSRGGGPVDGEGGVGRGEAGVVYYCGRGGGGEVGDPGYSELLCVSVGVSLEICNEG